MKPNLKNVTCLQIEALHPDRAARVLNWCAQSCDFGDVVLLSPRPPTIPFVGRWVQIPKFGYVGYSTFSTKCLAYYVRTDFALVTQHDGFIIHPENWRADFFEYDYIGAPWPKEFGDHRVGNSGFSLRSQAFLRACAEVNIAHNNEVDDPESRRYMPGVDEAADDIWMCKNEDIREWMAGIGIEYAPVGVAKFFASELEIPEIAFDDKKVFGFHDFSRRLEREEYKKLVGWTDEKLPPSIIAELPVSGPRPVNSRVGKLTPGVWGR